MSVFGHSMALFNNCSSAPHPQVANGATHHLHMLKLN